MKSKDLIIATALILIVLSLLSSCTFVENNVKDIPVQTKNTKLDKSQILEKMALVKKLSRDVDLNLEYKKENKNILVKMSLNNPSKKPIQSAETWFSFNPELLKVKSVDASLSDFNLPAPYKVNFDNEKGLLMIGRSNKSSINKENINLVQVNFELLKDESTTLNAYNYNPNLTGNSSVNIVYKGKVYNVLKEPKIPTLIIKK